jgi:hypothetical protein
MTTDYTTTVTAALDLAMQAQTQEVMGKAMRDGALNTSNVKKSVTGMLARLGFSTRVQGDKVESDTVTAILTASKAAGEQTAAAWQKQKGAWSKGKVLAELILKHKRIATCMLVLGGEEHNSVSHNMIGLISDPCDGDSSIATIRKDQI